MISMYLVGYLAFFQDTIVSEHQVGEKLAPFKGVLRRDSPAKNLPRKTLCQDKINLQKEKKNLILQVCAADNYVHAGKNNR